jgi:hypothetical protein
VSGTGPAGAPEPARTCMGIRTRLIAATAAAMLTTMAGTATASSAPASPTTSAPSGDKKEGPNTDDIVVTVAASLHVTVRQLVTALDHLKQAIGKGTARDDAVKAFGKELKISAARAEKALQALSNDGKPKPKPGNGKESGVPAEAVTLLATELHISADRARQVFKDLEKVNGKGEDVVKDPAFIAIAKGLGISPERLLATLVAVKQAVGKPKEKVPSGSPTK